MSKSRASIGRLASASAVLGGAFAAVVGLASMVCAQAGNTTAGLVLGQIDLEHNTINFGGLGGLFNPASVAVDTSGHVYVADLSNNRVLGWASVASLTDGAPADLVIGQPDAFSYACATTQNGLCLGAALSAGIFSSDAVATDPAGNLYVADVDNSRVLEFDSPFTSGMTAGQPAHLVFGQGGSFTSRARDCGAFPPTLDGLCNPTALAVDPAGNLYATESMFNNRVLEYNTPLVQTSVPGSGDTTADLVFGGCTSGTPAADCLIAPGGLAADEAGNLYVADGSRVLEFNTPLTKTTVPGSGDTVADMQWRPLWFPTSLPTCPLLSPDLYQRRRPLLSARYRSRFVRQPVGG